MHPKNAGDNTVDQDSASAETEDVSETGSYWRERALRVERERDSLLEGLRYVEDAVHAARDQAARRAVS